MRVFAALLQVRRLSLIIASGIQPVQNLRVLKKHGLEHKVEWGQWAINKGFQGQSWSSVWPVCVCVRVLKGRRRVLLSHTLTLTITHTHSLTLVDTLTHTRTLSVFLIG